MTSPAARTDIVFYTRQLHNGGVDRVVFNLAEEFLARGIACTILVDIDNPWSPFRPLIPAGVRYEVLDARGPVARYLKLRRYLRAAAPKAVMCTSFGFPNLFAVLVRRTDPEARFHLMLTEHCFPSVDRAQPKIWQSRWWFFPLASLLYPHADSIVAVSRGTAHDLAKVIKLDPATISFIYNPIVSDQLITQSREDADHPWFSDGGPPVIIAVGRMEAQKNYTVLIQAFDRVRRHRAARLLILGDGTERAALERLVAALGLQDLVAMPGFAPNPHAYVARSALLVLSSDFESLANVVIEGMAVGTPVVATDCPSGPAEALDGGRCGTLVPVGDIERLSQAMLAVLREPRQSVPASWLQQFTTRHAADRYLELLTAHQA